MELFEKLKMEDLAPWDAQIVGKNMFCQNPGEEKNFNEYFSFCLEVATRSVEIETRTFFVNEAELALDIFSEKCNMNESMLKVIQEARSKLVSVSNGINESIQKKQSEENDNVLSDLIKLKKEMYQAEKQTQFDDVLKKMSNLEERLDKAALDQKQTEYYNSLTKNFSNIVSKKMTEIAHDENIQYNKEAVDSFKKAFDLFKANEDKYKKSESELRGLVSKYLFKFDAKRLFNECLVYYNHVYSYIFNKLDDDGKFIFTKFSFDTQN